MMHETGQRRRETYFLASLSLLCFCFSAFRIFYTESRMFLFLNWNLFLAFIPWGLSSLVHLRPKLRESKLTLLALLTSWLLFFPNAPYILTDLFHLRITTAMPIWFDLVLVLSFAWTGLLFGIFSLFDIEKLLKPWLKQSGRTTISILLIFLASFGIYLGRYLRWNSWDLVANPYSLLQDIGDRVLHPAIYPGAWGMTLFMGIFLSIVYLSFKYIRSREAPVNYHKV